MRRKNAFPRSMPGYHETIRPYCRIVHYTVFYFTAKGVLCQGQMYKNATTAWDFPMYLAQMRQGIR